MSNFTKLMAQAAAGAAGGGAFYDYTIDNSIMFAGAQTLSFSQGTPTNNKKWTFSCWYKCTGNSSSWLGILGAGTSGSDYTNFYSNGNHFLLNHVSYGQMDTSREHNDTGAWLHVVVAYDSTQASAGDRQKIYVNGDKEGQPYSYGAWPQNFNTNINKSGYTLYIGRSGETASYSKQYLAECVFIDGQQLDPTSFAETKNGTWIPKDVSSLTFGNNGFHLKFDNAGALGTDSSGNSNNFTTSGISTYHHVADSPTENYPTFQGWLFAPNAHTYTNGNLLAQGDSAAQKHTRATVALPTTGKWYWEVQMTDARATDPPGTGFGIGISNSYGEDSTGYDKGAIFTVIPGSTSIAAYEDGSYTSADNITLSNAVVDGDWFGIAYDADTRKMWLWSERDNTWLASGDPANGTNPWKTLSALSITQDFFPIAATQTNDSGRWSKFGINFGQQAFAGTAPTDFLELKRSNIPEPTISPNIDANSSGTYTGQNFEPVLYTGNGSTQSITGVGFQPDWIWVKDRDAISQHLMTDVTRGVNSQTSPSTTTNYTLTNAITSFDSDGFSLGNNGGHNNSGDDFVAWCWKLANGTSTNTDGTITSTVSANTDAGISIAKFTASAGSIGHGLGVTPDVFWYKDYNAGNQDWFFWAPGIFGTINDYMRLSTTAAKATTTTLITSLTDSTVTITSNLIPGLGNKDTIMHFFKEIPGFSKFGTWAGKSGAEFVYTGFRPAFLLIKRTNASGWFIFDDVRGDNGAIYSLVAHTDAAESGPYDNSFEIYSNGFVDNGWIGDAGATCIYMAFAENPWGYANAR